MPTTSWSKAFEVGLPFMDDTHREFVDLLARARVSEDDALLAAWKRLIDHTEVHFAQEDAWMRATHFPDFRWHAMQHRMILQVMREGQDRAVLGDLTPARLMASELQAWFPQHAQNMDAVLAEHLRREGFDPSTGKMKAQLEVVRTL